MSNDKLRNQGRPGQVWTTGTSTFQLVQYCGITDKWSVIYQDLRHGNHPGEVSGGTLTSFLSLLRS